MASRGWRGLTQTQVARRMGRRLGISFAPGWPIGLGGFPDGLAGIGDDRWVAIEFEQSQSHPSENVLKYWPWLERNSRSLVLVHAIAPDARSRSGPRTDLTIWLGRRMDRSMRGRFRYCRIELDTTLEAAQIEAARLAIAELRSVAEPGDAGVTR